MMPLPSLLASFTDKAGKILSPWNFYLQQFTQAPPNFLDVDVDLSPTNYTAAEPGTIAIVGGTISDILLVRGTLSLAVTSERLIPVSINDTVEITWTDPPTVKFIPSYGQRTG